jgi:hypothetical protein
MQSAINGQMGQGCADCRGDAFGWLGVFQGLVARVGFKECFRAQNAALRLVTLEGLDDSADSAWECCGGVNNILCSIPCHRAHTT